MLHAHCFLQTDSVIDSVPSVSIASDAISWEVIMSTCLIDLPKQIQSALHLRLKTLLPSLLHYFSPLTGNKESRSVDLVTDELCKQEQNYNEVHLLSTLCSLLKVKYRNTVHKQ